MQERMKAVCNIRQGAESKEMRTKKETKCLTEEEKQETRETES